MLKKFKNTEGTVAYLNLIQSVLKAYVNPTTTVADRIFHGVYAVMFLRIWRQWLHDKKFSVCHFTSQNSWEGLEMLLVLLIKLAQENKAENIHLLNSQECEAFFRKLRSYTGVESMIVNCSMKGFMTRNHRIQIDEKLMFDLKERFIFPKLLAREKRRTNPKGNLRTSQIHQIIETAMKTAYDITKSLNMSVKKIELEKFLKPVSIDSDMRQEPSSDEEIIPDFLGSENDEINIDILNEDSVDRNGSEISTLVLQNIELTNESSGIIFLFFISFDHLYLLFKIFFQAETPFLKVLSNSEEMTIRKSRLCWLLQNDSIKASSDIKHRFVPKKLLAVEKTQNQENVWSQDQISRGDFVIIKQQKFSFYLGCVLHFQKPNATTKTRKTFSEDSANLEKFSNLQFLLDPIYQIKPDYSLIEINGQNKYYPLNLYVCHVKDANVNLKDCELSKFINK